MRSLVVYVCSLAAIAASPLSAVSVRQPMAVSPGSTGLVTHLAEPCPTFSWTESPSVSSYQLVVYQLTENGSLGSAVLQQSVPAGASTWTAPLDQCLARGGTYAWTVGAIADPAAPAWSDPALFQVLAGPTETELAHALAVVRDYLADRSPDDPDGPLSVTREYDALRLAANSAPAETPAAPAATQLTVDGNIDATSFTGDGSNLTGIATDTDLTTHTAVVDAHFDHPDSLAELNSQLSTSIADGPHVVDTDTTCSGATCDGSSFTNVTAIAGDSATAFFTTGQVEEARIADAIARDSELTTLGGSVWALSGNSGTDSTTEFLGTTDDEPLMLATNSTDLMRVALDSVSHSQASTATPFPILDFDPVGVEDSITVDDHGIASTFSVGVNLVNSDISAIRVELTAPDMTPYVLYDGGSSGTSLDTSFPSPTAPVSGNLTTWIGGNPVGTWTLKVIDSATIDQVFDGQLLAWSVDFDTMTDPNVLVLGRLELLGNLAVGEVSASGMINAPMFSGDGSGMTNVSASTASTALTATALAADGTNCPAGQWASGVDASGNAQGCIADGGIDHGFAILNTSVGYQALDKITSGYGNSASGAYALFDNTTGYLNTASGYGALLRNTSGNYNTADGARALRSNTSGGRNTASGFEALSTNTTGSYNTASGFEALYANTSGTENTALGAGALKRNMGDNPATTGVVEGSENTGVGRVALANNTYGSSNTATGVRSLYSNSTGSSNTASGSGALRANTTGSHNSAIGYNSLHANTTGWYNTANGSDALSSNTDGDRNTASGADALRLNTTGSDNTAVGDSALYQNSTGSYNTAIGKDALRNATTGRFNIAIGAFAGDFTTGSFNILVGSKPAGYGDSHTIRIGADYSSYDTGGQKKAFIGGIRGVTTGINNAVAVLIDSAGQLGTVSSSARHKEEIENMDSVSDRLLELRPVTFRYRKEFADGEKPVQFGLIAEEVAEIFPELVVYDEGGQPETVKYHLLSTLLLNELKKQAARIEKLEAPAEKPRGGT